MGSRKGIRNRRTEYREYKERVGKIIAINGNDVVGDSLAVMGEAMNFFLTQARAAKAVSEKIALYIDAAAVAEKLAPYRYPRLASIHTNAPKDSALERIGATEQQVMAEVESGELPRSVKGYFSNGDGTGKIGGVANRNAD